MENTTDIGNLKQHYEKLTHEEKSIRIMTFYKILEGNRPSVSELSIKSGLPESEVRKCIETLKKVGTLVLDEEGSIVGSHGLSLVPTKHRLIINNTNLYTWCAADAIGIPAALGADAKIVSNCSHCNSNIEIDMVKGNIQYSNHKDACIWVVEADLSKSIVGCTCPQINFFCSVEHFNKAICCTNGRLLTLTQAVQLGHCWWEDVRSSNKF